MQLQSVEARTLAYWKISSSWRGKNKQSVETQQALDRLNDVIGITFYKRPLLEHAILLQREIIVGRQRKKKNTSKNVPISLEQRRKPL